MTQPDHREVFWSVPLAELSSCFSEGLPFSPGFSGGSASGEKWVKVPTPFTLGAEGVVRD